LFEVLCAKALPAAAFEALLVLLSLSTAEAALPAFLDVTFLGALVCDNVLPAAVLDLDPVDLLLRVEDAFCAAFGLVTFDLVIFDYNPFSTLLLTLCFLD